MNGDLGFISVGDDQSDDVFGFQDIIEYLLGLDDPPHVLTTSYGANEDEISASVAEYALLLSRLRLRLILAQVALQCVHAVGCPRHLYLVLKR